MIFKVVVLLFLSIAANRNCYAQHPTIKKQLQFIDSLSQAMYYDEAEKQADMLLEELRHSVDPSMVSEERGVLLEKSIIILLKGNSIKTMAILLPLIEAAESAKDYRVAFLAELQVALVQEIAGELALCKQHLDNALQLHQMHRLDSIYSQFCIRISSYYRFTQKTKDSAIQYAKMGASFAGRYHNVKDLTDAYLLLNLLSESPQEAIKYGMMAAQMYWYRGAYKSAGNMYNNIAAVYRKAGDIPNSFIYSDSAFNACTKANSTPSYTMYRTRMEIYELVGNSDSALVYSKKYRIAEVTALMENENLQLKKITAQYDIGKKEGIIKTQNLWLLFISLLAIIVATASVLLIRNNRKIKSQHQLIQQQLKEEQMLVSQKEMLVAELQHRVKNNLQQVISMLEIQKESIAHNSLEEVTRQSQNRIHSMALLHNKLSPSGQGFDFQSYLKGIVASVSTSYHHPGKNITVEARSSLKDVHTDIAMPLGLIIVELMSNSFKHAFNKQQQGSILIEADRDQQSQRNKLSYSDTGPGYNFDTVAQNGLGIEIIKGLSAQIKAVLLSEEKEGFALTIYF